MTEQNVRMEEIKVQSTRAFERIQELVRAGNIRRLIVNNKERKELLNIPLTIGIIGMVLAPQLALLAAIVALLIGGSIAVEKVEELSDEVVDEAVEGMFEI